MKSMKDSGYCLMLVGVVLLLCCVSTVTYATLDDEPMFKIPEWEQFPLHPDAIIIEGASEKSLEWIMPQNYVMPEEPWWRNGIPPVEGVLNYFSLDYLNSLMDGSYGAVISFSTASSTMESTVVVVPEPATILFFGLGTLVLRRQTKKLA